jgi:hypothetical protein
MEKTLIHKPLELLDLLEATAALNEISTNELILAAIKSFLEKQREQF